MSVNRNGKKGAGFNIGFILALIIAFNVFPPAGILMILWRVGVFDKKTTPRNISSESKQSLRMDKYKIMTEDRSVESIEYLASALGVSYDTALRDLQKMVADGRFGPNAYINYVDRTVVLRPDQAARQRYSPPKARPAKADSQGKTESQAKTDSQSAESSRTVMADSQGGGSGKAASWKDQPYESVRTVLLIAGILLIGFGILRLAVGEETLMHIISGALMAAGGLGILGYRGFLSRRSGRMKLYEAACMGRDCVPISELAAKAGVSPRKCRRDLEAMIEKGMLTRTAYIDQGDGILVLKPGASPKAEASPAPPADDEDRYMSILRQIRQLNDEIPDEDVSRRIDEMEDLTGRIFKAVQEKPEKEPQIKSFMSYYLPTTLKLLRSYADFEKSGADGENIRSTKAEIERILDTLVDGFKKQLDKLFEAEAMDISSDIDVLETMLRRDGLASDGSAFQAQRKP